MNITINVAGDLVARHSPSAGVELGELFRSARLSRAQAPATGFTKILADGTELPADSNRTDHVAVIDHSTGLTWLVESIGAKPDEGQSQQDCEKACAKLDVLGFKDWRLPTRSELISIIDETRVEPAINVDLFPRVKPRWHWTSTPYAGSPSSSAWFVLFYYGLVSRYPRNSYGFALAVRRSGQ